MNPTTSPEMFVDGQDGFLNVKEAAKFLHFSVGWVYQKVSERTLPHFKIHGGRRVLFSRLELAKWIMRDRPLTREQIEEKAEAVLRRSR